MKLHVSPLRDEWNATAAPQRATRSQTSRPSTTIELQSSDTPRVTTDTTIGSPSGEYSKQSFAHLRSSLYRTSTPASNDAANWTFTRALRMKSPLVGASSAGASSLGSRTPSGSMNQSDSAPASITSAPPGPISQRAGL